MLYQVWFAGELSIIVHKRVRQKPFKVSLLQRLLSLPLHLIISLLSPPRQWPNSFTSNEANTTTDNCYCLHNASIHVDLTVALKQYFSSFPLVLNFLYGRYHSSISSRGIETVFLQSPITMKLLKGLLRTNSFSKVRHDNCSRNLLMIYTRIRCYDTDLRMWECNTWMSAARLKIVLHKNICSGVNTHLLNRLPDPWISNKR